MGAVLDATPGPVNGRNDIIAQVDPGSVHYSKNGKIYKYVQHNQGAAVVAAVAGGPAYMFPNGTAYDGTIVSPDATATNTNLIAGFYLNVPTHLYYCWIQVWGYLAAAPVPASTAVGDSLLGSTTDNLLVRVANGGTAPVQRVAAYALTAISGGLSDIYIVVGP